MNKIWIIAIAVLGMLAFLLYQSQSVKRKYQQAVIKELNTGVPDSPVITEEDLLRLPVPVRQYLRYAGVVGKPRVHNIRFVWEGKMRTEPNQKWFPFHFEQYNFFDKPARYFLIQGNMFGIPAVGLDSYTEGKGNMLIRLGGLLTVVDARDPRMDQAALATQFNDMCCFVPATLIDKRIGWEELDFRTVKATFQDNGLSVTGILHFNEKGQLVNFVTDDRYYSPTGKTYQRVRWSTPLTAYREINGVNIPTQGEAVWHMKEGDFTYGRSTDVTALEFNLNRFKLGK